MSRSRNGRAALWYAERGIAVFPINPRTKIPYEGTHAENDGTTDPETIDRVWFDEPDASVAAALRFTPFWVLDVDAAAFGHEWLAELEHRNGALPMTAMSISGSGSPGAHYWFRRTPELEEIRCRNIALRGIHKTGLDVKGLRAGYVVVPPSQHRSGRRYCWEASCRLDETEIADPPAWLVEIIRHRATKLQPTYQHPAPVDPESFYLGLMFKRARMLRRQIRNGVFAVECPNAEQHSQESGIGSTVIFAPQEPGGRGTFFCAHTSYCSEVFR